MSDTIIKVRRSKSDKDPVTVHYNFGESVDESVNLFDGTTALEKVVHGLFVASAKQQLQDFVRSLITPRVAKSRAKTAKGKAKVQAEAPAPLTAAEIQAKVDAWKPAVERRRKNSVARVGKLINKLSAEEKAALLEQLQD